MAENGNAGHSLPAGNQSGTRPAAAGTDRAGLRRRPAVPDMVVSGKIKPEDATSLLMGRELKSEGPEAYEA